MVNFILALLSEKNKLKTTSIYQVLIGKRTSSTLSFAYFNDLLPYLGMYPNLSLVEWDALVKKSEKAKHTYQTSEVDAPRTLLALEQYTAVNFYRYGRMTDLGWRLVQYFTQVVTQKTNEASPDNFLETAPFFQVTVSAVSRQFDQASLARQLYEELSGYFSSIETSEAKLLVQSLTGGEEVGKTFYQIFEASVIKEQRELILANALHRFYATFLNQKSSIIYSLLKHLYVWNLNQSLLETRKLILQKRSLAEISQIRKLKESTIRDHIIEWAILDENFPFHQFGTQSVAQYFLNWPLPAWELNYREVNQRGDVDFLSYRLYQIERKRGAND